MRNRITREGVIKSFESEGYEYLCRKSKNGKWFVYFECPSGHRHRIEWQNWRSGKRCGYCSGRYISIEDIKNRFLSEGYKLLSKEYSNNSQLLDFICINGHRWKISYSAWSMGQRCAKCAGNGKYMIKEIRDLFDNEGYTLLDREYTNGRKKLKYVCPSGHRGSIRFVNWNQGHRCNTCRLESLTGENSPWWKDDSLFDLRDFRDYKKLAQNITDRVYRNYKDIVNPENLSRGQRKYQIDHIYSVADGFREGIPIRVICNPTNLRMLYWRKNYSKRDRSDISLGELYRKYRLWKRNGGVVNNG